MTINFERLLFVLVFDFAFVSVSLTLILSDSLNHLSFIFIGHLLVLPPYSSVRTQQFRLLEINMYTNIRSFFRGRHQVHTRHDSISFYAPTKGSVSLNLLTLFF